MQKRLLVLVCMLVVSAILVTCFGAYLKYEILLPEGLFREKRLVEVPFAALADPAARFVLNRPKNQTRQMEPDPPPETVEAAATAPSVWRSAAPKHPECSSSEPALPPDASQDPLPAVQDPEQDPLPAVQDPEQDLLLSASAPPVRSYTINEN